MGESPDEPGHIQCIEQVALGQGLPTVDPKPEGAKWWDRGRIISGRMCYHMPLYYLIAGNIQHTTASIFNETIPFEFPPSNPNFPHSKSMFSHSQKASFWEIQQPSNLVVLRLFSILLGTTTLIAAYLFAKHIFPNQPQVATLSMLIIAVWPQFLFLNRAINNDALATALSVSIFVILIQTGSPKRFVWLALLSTLAIFTKLTVWFTAVVVFCTLIMEIYCFPQKRKAYMKTAVFLLLLWFGAGLILYSNPILNQHLSQSGIGTNSFNTNVFTWEYWGDVLRLTLSSGWVHFGWMNISPPIVHAYLWWVGVGITAVIGIFKLSTQPTQHKKILLLIMLLWSGGALGTYLRINLSIFQPQFRFIASIIPIISALVSAGIFLKQTYNMKIVMISVFFATALGYNIWVLSNLIKPIY